MASTINADTSGGLKQTADTSGVLQLQTASTTALTVTGSQKIGVGTTSPSQKFVVSNAGADNIVMCENTSTSPTTQMFMQGASSYGTVGTLSNHPALIYSNNTERMRFDTSGDIFAGGSTIASSTGAIYSSTTAKAFVQWNGSTGAINQSKNVSSVTRNGTGNYTVNFAFTFTTNYSIVLGGSRNNGRTDAFGLQYYGQTGSTVNIDTFITTVNYTDAYTADLVVFA